ncbi:uncharacterized protein E0L32_000556 [Thyridium curvatum]|uniref:PIN domain-containing protein n=1 Tax=Thyridium curvatum TaxID=1093900 RepID=A0A507AW26_9PEZI|nr:uncharacterized protein E0L32_000556 [Thyridium curvatum]TPX14162.1 hypothetical protein E0L32_000556 [Thyridium curvatum]
MGVAKKTRKFAQVKRVIGKRDERLKQNKDKADLGNKKKAAEAAPELIREVPQVSSALFFQANTALVPPYNVLVDTNFLSHTIQRKLPLLETMMDCLYAKCNPIITDCVRPAQKGLTSLDPPRPSKSMAEMERLGPKYRLALRIARDERWERVKCTHKGIYADDCIVDRVNRHRIYIVATNDLDLKRRIRKVVGVPIMSVARGKYVIERLPGAPET